MRESGLGLLTAQHDADVIGKLDHPGATATNGLWHTLGHIRRNECGDHADADTSEEAAEVEYLQADLLVRAETNDALNETTDEVDDTGRDQRRLAPKLAGEIACE